MLSHRELNNMNEILRDAFGTAIEKTWQNAKEKSRLFCQKSRFL